MIETISLIVGIASSILSSIGYFKTVEDTQKKELIDFFTSIADTLDTTVTAFKQNEVPHGACEQMRQYALALPDVLQNTMPAEKLQRYRAELLQAYQIETLLLTVRDHPEGLVALETAAGYFRATATLLKVAKD